MKQYEYQIFEAIHNLVRELNFQGQEGWRFVSILGAYKDSSKGTAERIQVLMERVKEDDD